MQGSVGDPVGFVNPGVRGPTWVRRSCRRIPRCNGGTDAWLGRPDSLEPSDTDKRQDTHCQEVYNNGLQLVDQVYNL